MSDMNNCCLDSDFRKWSIGKDIRALLIADSAITEAIGNNIYPLVAPEKTEGDFIIYQRDKYSKNWVKAGIYEDECNVVITIVSDNYDNSIELAILVDKALTGRHKTDDGYVFKMNILDSTEDYTDNKYIQTLLFGINDR